MAAGRATREWFRDWFGEEYLALYPHRDEAEAREAVELFREVTALDAGSRVLDIACGAGRHLLELRAAGLDATGLDLSMTLLESARARAGVIPLARGDMRELPFSSGAFRGLTSFFTSFGYFADPDDDVRVLREMARVLAPRGSFMLDFLNAARVREDLVAEDETVTPGSRVVQLRSISGGVVVKRIRIEPLSGGPVRHYEERVRLYSCDELEGLLVAAGLLTTHRFGDYGGAAFTAASPRLILAGRSSPEEVLA